MRIHLVGLPHTQSTAKYNNCAFNSLLRGQAAMMKSLGHEVIVYSGEDNDAECDEHVECISKAEQAEVFNIEGPGDILKPPLDSILYRWDSGWWAPWNDSVWSAMESRIQPQDIVGVIGGGVLFEPLIRSVLAAGGMPVEYAIGYAGISPNVFHAFGSDNWRHVVYGMNPPTSWRGAFYDRTIPHYFDPTQFEFREEKGDYFLYLGKLKEDKGINVAARACQAAGERLILAGDGPTPVEYGETLRRYIGPEERKELLAGAKGLFVPSLYTEPFGMIAVEGLLSGTPIITTPFGGLGNINKDGETGFICNTLQDFVRATKNIDTICTGCCRNEGEKYTYNAVAPQYQRWYDDLQGLYGEGWGALSLAR